MKISVKRRSVMLCGCLLMSSAASAQYSPDATMDLGTGYGQIAMSQSILNGTRTIGKKSSGALQSRPGSLQQPSAAEMAAMQRLIEPEYKRRVRVDGKASADRWLAATAREMGLRAGRAARANSIGAAPSLAPMGTRSGPTTAENNRRCKRTVWQTRNVASLSSAPMIMVRVPKCVAW
jgi:hypothetical protein